MRMRIEDITHRLRESCFTSYNQLTCARRIVRIHHDQVILHLDDSCVAVALRSVSEQEPDSRRDQARRRRLPGQSGKQSIANTKKTLSGLASTREQPLRATTTDLNARLPSPIHPNPCR